MNLLGSKNAFLCSRRICRRQLRQQRWRSQSARLPDKSVLELSGPDVVKFLKGLSCKDVDATQGGYSGFLNASGRVLHDVFIYPAQANDRIPTYLIVHESPSGHPMPLNQLLPPFRLRSKVKFKDVTDAWSVWAVWGEESIGSESIRSWKVGGGGSAEPVWTFPQGTPDLRLYGSEVGCWDLRAGLGPRSLGKRVLVPRGSTPSFSSDSEDVGDAAYHAHRMAQGVPEGPAEILPEIALPLESCMDIHGGIDFRKGCYLGQELTVRTYHTGVTRKRIMPIHVYSLQDPSVAIRDAMIVPDAWTGEPTEVTYHPGEGSPSRKSKSAGRLLRLHEHAGSIGLGLVRLELASRCWLSDCADLKVGEMGSRDRMTVKFGTQDWGVLVNRGEAYRALEAYRDP